MSAKIIQFPDRKNEVERIKGLEDWVEMQFWMYEQHLLDELKYLEVSTSIETGDGKENESSDLFQKPKF